jgi:muramidase (phage lysozyme)
MKINSTHILAGLAAVSLIGCGVEPTQDLEIQSLDAESEPYILIGNQDTVLKKTTADSSTLTDGSEKCELPAGSKVALQLDPQPEGSHFLVNTKEMLANCGFSKGYVFRPHIAKSSAKALFSANVSAFLDTIGYAEGTGDRYDYMFTHKVFYSYAAHPRQLQCSYGLCSDAAGRYQFLSTTWDGMRRKLGLPDFSPESQDRAAVQLIKDVGCYSSVVNIDGPNSFSRAAYCVSGQWASFPGSPYGQRTHSSSHLYGKFTAFLKRY